MRVRFIKTGVNHRIMVRARCTEDLCSIAKAARTLGYEEVSLIRFVKHIFFWWRKRKDIAKEG